VRLRLAEEKIRQGHAAAALVDTRVALRAGGPLKDVVAAHLAALLANRRCRDANRLLMNTIPGWRLEALETLRENHTPERAWCDAHPGFNTPNNQLPAEPRSWIRANPKAESRSRPFSPTARQATISGRSKSVV
jgi:hypothetical protein